MEPSNRPPLADQTDRDRFTSELDRNFSVTAPAGVGKTTSIVDRVFELARSDAHRDEPALPRLSMVTYTRKAADEMRRRTAEKLHQENVGPEVFTRFHQAFFGTIHSFCLDLLRQYGALAGLAPQVEQASNEDALWWEFLRGRDQLLDALPEEVRVPFTRIAAVHKVFGLARDIGPQIPEPAQPGPPPEPNLSPIIDFKPPNKRALAGIEEGKRLAADWLNAFQDPNTPCPLPEHKKGGKEFQALWTDAWLPLKQWLGDVCLYLACQLAREFRDFRVARGQINYGDMVALAASLLDDPAAGPAIRSEKRIIILDEAQDTDRLQFALLLNIAGAEWDGQSPLRNAVGPELGRYCQVGDPQQAIYSSRADLATYREIHHDLVEIGAADELSFTVTMRCDEAIVQAVNQFYPNILQQRSPLSDQTSFVPLTARPLAGPGRTERLRLDVDPASLGEKPSVDARSEAELRAFARWLAETGHAGLGEDDWSEIAILSPRKGPWLEALINALDRENLPWQAHSGQGARADDPVWAWTAALTRVMSYPEDDFEAAGVLREVFALPDDAIAHYLRERRASNSEKSSSSDSIQAVHDAWQSLEALRAELQDEALSDAFRLILERLRLPERLAALPDQSPVSVDLALKRLMANALSAEELGSDLADWSGQLIQALASDPEGDDPKPGCLQLLTCHKAKGLQWGVVIAPLAYRSIGFKDDSFPRYYPETKRQPAFVAYDAATAGDADDRLKIARTDELERLAYVTWTRARRRLILVDGGACFEGAKTVGSWIDLWQAADNGPNTAAWESLPDFQIADQHADKSLNGDNRSASEQTPLFTAIERHPAPSLADSPAFPKRILPSSLAQHPTFDDSAREAPLAGHARDERDWRSEPGYQEIGAGGEALGGADYGNWWHHLMETGPWSHPPETWEAHFDHHLPHCPIPERGEAEFRALLNTADFLHLSSESCHVRPEAALLWPEGAQVSAQPELGLAAQQSPQLVYDGFIDLLVHEPAEDRWRIVDWKTDRIGDGPASELLAAYGPQLAAYVEALRCMFQRPVDGFLYSTRAALWIPLP